MRVLMQRKETSELLRYVSKYRPEMIDQRRTTSRMTEVFP